MRKSKKSKNGQRITLETKMNDEILSKELLEILVCPICKADVELVEYRPGEFGLKCASGHGIYPIRNGIPVMLVDELIKE
jgi:uncharacterized protein YbaR (Trm112 family)